MSESKKTVLIVDDEDDARAFAEAVVCEVGDCNVITAADGKSGLSLARETVPDLVILDVMMPGRSGFLVFHDIRQDERLANTPVIMLTGVSAKRGIRFSGKDMEDYMGEEPLAFLDKPVDPEILEQTVRQALGLQIA